MANLKSLKLRIRSVKSTGKMTKAMKMVAASKLRRARNAVESSRPYAEKISELIIDVASNVSFRDIIDDRFALLTGHKDSANKHLIIVLSSDRGLCGGLNTNIVKYAKNHARSLIENGKEVKIICIGKKAFDQLKAEFGDKIVETIFGIFKANIEYKVAEDLATKIISLFEKREFDICEVIYNKFKSAIVREPTKKQLIPAPISLVKNKVVVDMPISYEPDKELILCQLLVKNLTMQIYNQLLENAASEQGARMSAMESATNNANKMIKNLTLIYNRTRQSNITRELIDIVSGANAI